MQWTPANIYFFGPNPLMKSRLGNRSTMSEIRAASSMFRTYRKNLGHLELALEVLIVSRFKSIATHFIKIRILKPVQCGHSRHRSAKRHTAAFLPPVGSRAERAVLPQQQQFRCAVTALGLYCPLRSLGHASSSRDGLHKSIFSV